jgi:hypothetical protein
MTSHPLETRHRLVQNRDASGLKDLLADDAVFYSPVVHTPQLGRDLVAAYLGAAFSVFFSPTFRYVREIVGHSDAMLRKLGLGAICLVFGFAPASAQPVDESLTSATSFLQLVQSGKFVDAAREFRYPPEYDPAELLEDQAAMARTLEALFRVTGKMKGNPRQASGLFVTAFFSLKGGSRAHPLPDADAANAASYRFSTPLENYPDAAFHIELDRTGGKWMVREFKLALPGAGADSRTRIAEVAAKVAATL